MSLMHGTNMKTSNEYLDFHAPTFMPPYTNESDEKFATVALFEEPIELRPLRVGWNGGMKLLP